MPVPLRATSSPQDIGVLGIWGYAIFFFPPSVSTTTISLVSFLRKMGKMRPGALAHRS